MLANTLLIFSLGQFQLEFHSSPHDIQERLFYLYKWCGGNQKTAVNQREKDCLWLLKACLEKTESGMGAFLISNWFCGGSAGAERSSVRDIPPNQAGIKLSRCWVGWRTKPRWGKKRKSEKCVRTGWRSLTPRLTWHTHSLFDCEPPTSTDFDITKKLRSCLVHFV